MVCSPAQCSSAAGRGCRQCALVPSLASSTRPAAPTRRVGADIRCDACQQAYASSSLLPVCQPQATVTMMNSLAVQGPRLTRNPRADSDSESDSDSEVLTAKDRQRP